MLNWSNIRLESYSPSMTANLGNSRPYVPQFNLFFSDYRAALLMMELESGFLSSDGLPIPISKKHREDGKVCLEHILLASSYKMTDIEDRLVKRYNSTQALDKKMKEGGDIFEGMLYLKFFDRKDNVSYYIRNGKLIESFEWVLSRLGNLSKKIQLLILEHLEKKHYNNTYMIYVLEYVIKNKDIIDIENWLIDNLDYTTYSKEVTSVNQNFGPAQVKLFDLPTYQQLETENVKFGAEEQCSSDFSGKSTENENNSEQIVNTQNEHIYIDNNTNIINNNIYNNSTSDISEKTGMVKTRIKTSDFSDIDKIIGKGKISELTKKQKALLCLWFGKELLGKRIYKVKTRREKFDKLIDDGIPAKAIIEAMRRNQHNKWASGNEHPSKYSKGGKVWTWNLNYITNNYKTKSGVENSLDRKIDMPVSEEAKALLARINHLFSDKALSDIKTTHVDNGGTTTVDKREEVSDEERDKFYAEQRKRIEKELLGD